MLTLKASKRGNKCQTSCYKDASNPYAHKWIVECVSCGEKQEFNSPQKAFNYQHTHVLGEK
jgi:hypothetical protein